MGSENVLLIFRDFMTRIAKLEELGAVGCTMLNGFQQSLGLLRRPPLDMESVLVKNVIEANGTERLRAYIEAGCVNSSDRIQNVSKLQTCLLGLRAHLNEAKSVLNELKSHLEDLSSAIKEVNVSLFPSTNEDSGDQFGKGTTIGQEEEESPSVLEELEMADYVSLLAIIYSMLKRDYVMQEKIIASLNLKSSSEELESYCLMWSLRPFVNDEIVHQAWKRIR